jgi:hypothetical protein
VETPAALKDIVGRVNTVRTLLGGKDMHGNPARYVCADSRPGLLWFIECLEKASWPTDHEGEVQCLPGGLANNRYTQHANAFSYAMEGYLRMPAVNLLPVAGGRPGILKMQF